MLQVNGGYVNCLISILAFTINLVLKTLLQTHLAVIHFLKCNLERYNQNLNPDEVKSAFDTVVNQVENNETWVAAVNTINTFFSDIENQILYDVGDQKTTLASQDLAKYQAEEKWIQLVIQFKKKGEYPDKSSYKQLPTEPFPRVGELTGARKYPIPPEATTTKTTDTFIKARASRL